ncbi:hypothetical protein [Acholeplasma granularum]|uniref:hypothetical protein n=1 Tax=Acholeplasma granularum TaxID=264635 RepID=UPI00046F407F|nr:hypothetical protein [Acholeplasma granularum]
MKKENLVLVLMFGLMLLISVVGIGFKFVFPTSPVDKMFNQSVNVINETPVVDADYNEIISKGEVTSLSGEKLADIYTVRVDHTYFYLELYVAIDEDNKIYARDKHVKTKDDTSSSYFPLVREYLLKNYNGIYYENVQFVDGAAGATTIVVSRSTIKNIISKVAVYHVGEPVDYIQNLFGKKYTLNSQTTVNDVIKYDVTVDSVNYNVYEAKKSGTYYDYQKTNNGEITVFIALNQAGEITHVLLPESLYGHSGGNFYNETKAYLENLVGNPLINELPDSQTGPTENSSGSQEVVRQILLDIKEVA